MLVQNLNHTLLYATFAKIREFVGPNILWSRVGWSGVRCFIYSLTPTFCKDYNFVRTFCLFQYSEPYISDGRSTLTTCELVIVVLFATFGNGSTFIPRAYLTGFYLDFLKQRDLNVVLGKEYDNDGLFKCITNCHNFSGWLI